MRQRPQAHPELEVLQLACPQDFVQDGDPEAHHCCHVPTPVDGQRGSEGCLLPHRSGTGIIGDNIGALCY